jgi:hypothetical protein
MQAGTIVSDRASDGDGLTHVLGNATIGNGASNFIAGSNVTGGTAAIQLGNISNNNGIVNLTNTETVAAPDFDGTPQPSGNYSATSVPGGATITTASFSGSGTLTIGPPTGGSYVNDGSTISYTLTPGTPAKNFLRLRVSQ